MPNAGNSRHTAQNLRSYESGEHAWNVCEARLKRRIQLELAGEMVSGARFSTPPSALKVDNVGEKSISLVQLNLAWEQIQQHLHNGREMI